MRVFVANAFRRLQRNERIQDATLCDAIARAERGLIDAGLGAGLIKQRVARKGQGRSGGFRTVIAYRAGERSVYIYGFAKSRQANNGDADVRDLAAYGGLLLSLDEDGIESVIIADELKEIECHDET